MKSWYVVLRSKNGPAYYTMENATDPDQAVLLAMQHDHGLDEVRLERCILVCTEPYPPTYSETDFEIRLQSFWRKYPSLRPDWAK